MFSVSLAVTPVAVAATVTATSTAKVKEEHSKDSGGGRLSTGAKAGIGVGAGVGGLLILAAGMSLFWWRQKSKNPKTIHEISTGRPDSAPFSGSEGQKIRPDSVPGTVPLSLGGGTSARRFESGG